MHCIKDCKCQDCENLMMDSIVFIKQKGLIQKRNVVSAFHCTFTGRYSENLKDLKKSNYVDNFIYI